MVKDKELIKRIITAVVLLALLPLILSGNFIWTLSMVGIALLAWREWWNMSKDFNHIIIGAGSAYIATAIASAIYLRELHGGVALICFSLSSVIAMDIAAYFGGKRFGKTPLAPKISPKKTLEGLGCGLLASIMVGIVFSEFSGLKNSIIFAMIIALLSQGGDLLVSFFKRKAGIKDSGNILPGHGGVLDRIDGHLSAFITLFLLLGL
jgi:phosphatidate cytidylyltransferase